MAKYDLSNSLHNQQFLKRVEVLKDSKKLVELKEIKPIRSNQQNKYLHLIFGMVVMETGFTMEEVKQGLFKQVANKDMFVLNFKSNEGDYMILRSTADLDTAEMTKAIDRFRDYMGAQGYYIPAPNETEWLQQIEAEISRQSI